MNSTAVKTISRASSAAIDFGSPDRVEHHLLNWRNWMQSEPVRGAPGRCTVVSSGGASQDFDSMADLSDRQTARIVDVLVSDLPHPQRSAVGAKYLHSRFLFGTSSFSELLECAKARIARGLATRGVW